MCTCSDEYPDCQRTTFHTTRKPKHCGECRRMIERGEPYERYFSVWEGSASTSILCAGCWLWRRALFEAQERVCGCSGYMLGELWSEIADFCREHLGYDPRFHLEAA